MKPGERHPGGGQQARQEPGLATKELKATVLLEARQQRVDVLLLNMTFALAVGNIIKGLAMREE